MDGAQSLELADQQQARATSPSSINSIPSAVSSSSIHIGSHGEAPEEQWLSLPPFLRQSRTDIQEKFQELEWLQRARLLQSQQNPDPASPWAQEQDVEVKQRNRYMNVQAWRNNRVHLKVPPGRCDYINASPIVLSTSKGEKKYIATQGPKEGQFNHIWRMIWHETSDPAVVVMLTQTWEAGRDKCFQYFPNDLDNDTLMINDEDEFEDGFNAKVKLLEITEDEATRSTVRKLSLTVGGESKTVWHFLFAGWPDFSTPKGENRVALLRLIDLSAQKNTSPDSPRIIHCSAGVGRSGTFIALDYLLEETASLDGDVEEGSEQDLVFDTVNKLREQRMTMVQSETQFEFIYGVLRQHWLSNEGRTAPDSAQAYQPGNQLPEGVNAEPP